MSLSKDALGIAETMTLFAAKPPPIVNPALPYAEFAVRAKEAGLMKVSAEVMTDEHAEFACDLLEHKILTLPFKNTLFQFDRGAIDVGQPRTLVLAWIEDHTLYFAQYLHLLKRYWCVGQLVKISPDGIMHRVDGRNLDAPLKKMTEKEYATGQEKDAFIDEFLLTGALGLLASSHADKITHRVDAALNKSRARKGKPPLKDWIEIRLSAAARSASQGGTHGSPVVHWRRGHIRQIRSGRLVPVAPTYVGASPELRAQIKAGKIEVPKKEYVVNEVS